MGLLAQRCGIIPTNAEDEKLVSNFRTDFDEEKLRIEQGRKFDIDMLPAPNMTGKIVQHRVFDALDMYQHWDHLQHPEKHIEGRGCWQKCPDHVKNKNIILLDHYGSQSLDDVRLLFDQVVQLAGYLCAHVRVPPPRSMVRFLLLSSFPLSHLISKMLANFFASCLVY